MISPIIQVFSFHTGKAMAKQRKRRFQEEVQPVQPSVTASPTGLFRTPDMEVAEPEADYPVSNSTNLDLQRQQLKEGGGFNFGEIDLFPSSPRRGLQPHPMSLQPRLTVGPVGDKHEQEADRVASQVVNTINPPHGRFPIQRAGSLPYNSVRRQPVV